MQIEKLKNEFEENAQAKINDIEKVFEKRNFKEKLEQNTEIRKFKKKLELTNMKYSFFCHIFIFTIYLYVVQDQRRFLCF